MDEVEVKVRDALARVVPPGVDAHTISSDADLVDVAGLDSLRVVALLMAIWSFRRFEIIWLLTQGGPVDSTNTLVIDVYREAFLNSDLGRSAATGVVGLALSALATIAFALTERRAAREDTA
jgi:multiple sugar transport system permease protein